jgi:hypothetical protein
MTIKIKLRDLLFLSIDPSGKIFANEKGKFSDRLLNQNG